MNNTFLKDRDGNISNRIVFILINTILTWIIIFICIFKNIDIRNGVLTLLIALTTKSGIDSISQVYQNIKYNNSYYHSKYNNYNNKENNNINNDYKSNSYNNSRYNNYNNN